MSRKLWIHGRSILVSISRVCLRRKRQTENVAWRFMVIFGWWYICIDISILDRRIEYTKEWIVDCRT
jgi:hypothetical protein